MFHNKYFKLLVLTTIFVVNGAILKAQDKNFITRAFDSYLERIIEKCDFNSPAPTEVFNQLTPLAKSKCLSLSYEVEKIGKIVSPYETQIKCNDQKEINFEKCEQNLRLCKTKILQIRPLIEECRSVIKIDGQSLKYKTN